MITKLRHLNERQQGERERKEFLALADALVGPANSARADARWLVAKRLPSESTVRHLLAVWPEVERKRRRRAPLAILREHTSFPVTFTLPLYFALRMLGRMPAVNALVADPDTYRVFCVVAAPCLTLAAVLLTGLPGKRQRGLIRLLLETRDVRLVPAYLDALDLKGDAETERQTLIAHLTELLPRYADADAPPLDPHQRRSLLREVRRCSSAARDRRLVSDGDARFLTAALQALEMEIARTASAGDRAEDARERREARLLRETATMTHVYGWRPVAQAADDCLVRLQVRGAGQP